MRSNSFIDLIENRITEVNNMGNDYVSKLSEDEFKLVCERIVTDKALRNKFKDDPKGKDIRPYARDSDPTL